MVGLAVIVLLGVRGIVGKPAGGNGGVEPKGKGDELFEGVNSA